MSTTLASPVLVVRIAPDFRTRVVDFLRSSVEHLQLIHEESPNKKSETLLFFGPTPESIQEEQLDPLPTAAITSALAPPKTWTCDICTYINERNERGLMCAICDAPRSVVEWAGFPKTGSGQKAQLVRKLVTGFRICVNGAQALATHAGACRSFETGACTIATHTAEDWKALMTCVFREIHSTPEEAATEEAATKRIRIRCKRELQERLMAAHTEKCDGSSPGCLLAPSDFTHVFTAHEVSSATSEVLSGKPTGTGLIKNTAFLYGIVSGKNDFASITPNINSPTPPPKVVCRAYYKMEEAAIATQMMRDCFAAASDNCALDIGAAPGGWTAYLATKFKRVIAVDTAALAESVASLKNIVHIKKILLPPSQSASEEYVKTLAEIKESLLGTPSFVCCDINQEPVQACEIVLRTIPFISPGTIFMVTMKLNTRGAEGQAKMVRDAKELLQKYCSEIEEHWLFNNTKFERTLFARFTGDPAAVSNAEGPSHDDVSNVVKNRQRGLNVVVDCTSIIASDIEGLDHILNECHNHGVTTVHVIDSGAHESFRDHYTKTCKTFILDLKVHSSAGDCLKALPPNAERFAISRGEGIPTLYKTSFVNGEKSNAGLALWISMDYGKTEETGADGGDKDDLDVLSTFKKFSMSYRGLATNCLVCSVAGAVLSEISRQRVVSGFDDK